MAPKRVGKGKVALSTNEVFGNEVTLWGKSWEHARVKHGLDAMGIDLSSVKEAIAKPMRIRESTQAYATNAYLYEIQSNPTSPHIRIPVEYGSAGDIHSGKLKGTATSVIPVDGVMFSTAKVGKIVYEASHSVLPKEEDSE
jgi:hypothetical protein